MNESITVKTALVSVYDKTGLEPVIGILKKFGVNIYCTEGTASFLKERFSISLQTIESLTQFPALMDGRVKTLHPRIFGGILARRNVPSDVEEATQHQIPLFDLVICNLYPFWEHLKDDLPTQSSFVDIGGPSMIRAAAKNFESVTVVSHPDDYPLLVEELSQNQGATNIAFRHRLAARAFQRTGNYDSLIASQWDKKNLFPTSLSISPQKPLRYGENPQQKAAWAGKPQWRLLQGKELSFNNLLDTEAATKITSEFPVPCVSVVKHNNPCGVSAGPMPLCPLWTKAFSADSKSAFGGIVSLNRTIDGETANAMSEVFLEVIIAPSFDANAKKILSKKQNLRLIEWQNPTFHPFEVRSALGGWLIQESDSSGVPKDNRVVTTHSVPEELWDDLRFAWLVCKHVRSNAILIAKNMTTLGIGAGQMSRIDSVQIALKKCPQSSMEGAVLASDAFFPFRDNIDILKETGIRAIIQPGGSKRDAEVIEACNEHGIAMVFAGERHFRH